MNDKHKIISNRLDIGEELIWSDIPKQGIIFKSADKFMVPLGLFWLAFAIFWEYMALNITHNAPNVPKIITIVFPLFGIPFVIMGLYLVLGRFFYDKQKRANTFYALTNERIIIVSGILSKKVKSLDLKSIDDLSLVEDADGYGSIVLGRENEMMSMLMNIGFLGMFGSGVTKLEFINDAKSVYNKIREIQKK